VPEANAPFTRITTLEAAERPRQFKHEHELATGKNSKENQNSKSELKIRTQNQNSKSELKIRTQNQNSKSELKIRTRKSKENINTRGAVPRATIGMMDQKQGLSKELTRRIKAKN